MEERAYHYRSAGAWFVVGFLAFWSLGWNGALIASAISGKITINGSRMTIDEALPSMIPFVLIGLAVLSLTIWLGLKVWNERVVIEQGELRCYDWRGRLTVRDSLSSILPLQEGKTLNGIRKVDIRTAAGKFSINQSLEGFVGLCQRLEAGSKERASGIDKSVPSPIPATPRPLVAARSFRYVGGATHLFSFVWLGFCLFFVYALFFLVDSLSDAGTKLLMLVFMVPFFAVGIWLQMNGWNERVDVSDEGIRWTDCRRRVRVDASWEDLIGLNEVTGEANALSIETRKGTIRASSNLRGYSDLKQEVDRVFAARGG